MHFPRFVLNLYIVFVMPSQCIVIVFILQFLAELQRSFVNIRFLDDNSKSLHQIPMILQFLAELQRSFVKIRFLDDNSKSLHQIPMKL